MKNIVASRFGSLRSTAKFTGVLLLLATLAFGPLLSCSQAQTSTIQFTNIWNIAAGSRTYVSAAAGNERGITISPLTTNVILASRSGTAPSNPYFPVLDGNTGAEIAHLDATGVSGGTFSVNKILIASDGVVYAANLRAVGGSGFLKVYRWDSESGVGANTTIFNADLGDGTTLRWGDSMALRGGGPNTQIIVSGSANTKAVFFQTTDGTNFTPTVITLTGAGVWQKGLSFGAGNSMYAKLSADSTVKLYSFNTNAGTSALTSTYSGYDSSMVALRVDLTRNLLAGPLTANLVPQANHLFRIYDFLNPGSPTLLVSTNFPAPNAGDANLAGEADIAGDKIVGISAQNGIVAYKIYYVTNALPPTITGQPVGTTNLQGGFATFTVSANGTQPLRYQWYLNNTSTPIAGATTNVLVVTNLTSANNGNYFVVITNSALTANSKTSSLAFLAVSNSVLSTWLTPLYTVATGSRNYLADDANQRGLAYNSASNHLLVTSRTPGNAVYVLDADTGTDVRSMNVTGVTGGNGNPLNLIGAGDDGAVYACNLETGGQDFKIYRWADDAAATAPTVIFENATASPRLGDTLRVRGAGADTQIMVGEQIGGNVHIFTTDGVNWTEHIITTDVTGDALRNGLAFGRGNTYWSKDFGGILSYISFDLNSSSGSRIALYFTDYSFPTTIQPIAYDPVNDLLAAIAIRSGGVSPGPDNVRLYDVANLVPNEPIWLDTEFFATGNLNGFGTGALDFGNGRLYALDSHNGVAVYSLHITNGIPVVTVPPQTTTNNVGDKVLLGVNSSGYPHNYQWYFEGNPLDGETNASLILQNVQVANTTNYWVVITNVSGSVTSTVAKVWLRPTILAQPSPASQVIATNDPFSYTVTADGTPVLQYQWRLNGSPIAGATDATYSVANAQVSDSGNYTVVITNLVGSVTSTVAALFVQPSSTPGTGEGLRGDYYNNTYTVNPFAGPPVLTRTDATIDFDWGSGSPDPLINTDRFCVRWIGQIEPLYSQTYTIYTASDDGVRVWVNSQKLINNWTLHAPATNSGTIALTANQKYDLLMEYFEFTGGAVARLLWSSPSQPQEIIPAIQLYPAAEALQQPTNLTFTVNNKTNLIFNWGIGTFNVVWATNVNGPYTNVIVGAISPLTNRIGSEPAKFFRLQTQ